MNIEKAMAKAIREHSLVNEGDRILIGASGGKDSLAMSWLLSRMALRGRPAFGLGALKVIISPHVPEGLHDPPGDELSVLFADWGIPLRYFGIRGVLGPAADRPSADIDGNIPAGSNDGMPAGQVVTGCYRCASLRREALAKYALQEGYGSIALGHHLDDILVTALMNLVLRGGGPVMRPRRVYESLGLLLIRPMVYVPEESIRRLAAGMGWDSVTCTCPAGTRGDRAEFRRRLDVLCDDKLAAKLKLLKGLGIA